MSTWTEVPDAPHGAPDLRDDENAVRVLLVEASDVCARLLRASLAAAARGRFEVECANCLANAERCLDEGPYDAVLMDLALPDGEAPSLDAATDIAHRLPVIMLTGTQDGELDEAPESTDSEPLRRIDRAGLASKILRAIHRYRRVGGGGSDPVICRIPRTG